MEVDKTFHKDIYLTAIIGALFLALLKVFDAANTTSSLLVLSGLSLLIYAIRHATNKKEYVFIALILAITFIIRFYGYTGNHVLDIVLGFLIGLVMFMIMGFESLFKKYDKYLWYVLIYPLIYVLFLHFSEIVKINLPFRLDSYLSSFTLLCQITSIFGIYVIDFLLALTASVIIYVLDHRKERKTKTLIIIYTLIMSLVIIFGFIHLNKMNEKEALKTNTIRVTCATGPSNYSFIDSEYVPLTFDEAIKDLNETFKAAKDEDSDILVFSEEAYCLDDIYEESFINEAKTLALNNNIHVLLAYELVDTDNDNNGKGTNKLCFISNQGEILYEYVKYCLVPFVETGEYIEGEEEFKPFEIEVDGNTLNIATIICYDADYDFYTKSIDDSIDLLLIPTWDWKVVANEHLGVTRLRAIANGVTLIRSTYGGYTALIDSTGNILGINDTSNNSYLNVNSYDVKVN